MAPNWFVIDNDGPRAIHGKSMDFWQKFNYSGDDGEWPEFTQLVVGIKDASPDLVAQAITTIAGTLGLRCVDVTDSPDVWDSAIVLSRNGAAWSLAEPHRDLDERFLSASVADQIAGLMAVDAVYFGHSPDAGTLHVTTFDTGAAEVAWYDSSMPGPSFARVFNRNGSCTDEDPRTYALRVLGMPETSPLLDRYAFVQAMVEPFGVERVTPELEDLVVERAWQLED